MIVYNDSFIQNILNILKTINSTIDFDTLFNKIVNSIRDFLNVERCSLFIVDTQNMTLWSKVAQDLEIKQIILPIGEGLVGSCYIEKEIIIVNDPYNDKRFCTDVDKQTQFITKSLLCYPLKNLEGEVIGVLELINKIDGSFSQKDTELLDILSQHLNIALNNSIYFKESLEKRKMDTELSIAKNIQEKFLPHSVPHIDNLEIVCKNIQCNFVGGDYYDLFKIDQDNTLILIADVSGHGISSALIMTNFHAAIRMQNYKNNSLKQIISHLNDFIYDTVENEKYITCFIGIYNSKLCEINFVNAGHLPPLILRGNDVITLETTGIPIGLFPDYKDFEEEKFTFNRGDLFILYTDGITEAANGSDMFGIERLIATIKKHGKSDIQTISDSIINEVKIFTETQEDDITLIVSHIN